MVRTVLRDIGSLFVSLLVFIDSLPIHPFIKRAAVIEHSVQNHLHAAAVCLLHQADKQIITRAQISSVRHPGDVSGSLCIVLGTVRKNSFIRLHLFLLRDNFPEMRINIVIILRIIFVIGRGNENRVQIDSLNPQLLQIIKFIQHPLQIAAVKILDIHILRHLIPVIYLMHVPVNIIVLMIQNIIGRISVAEPVHKDLVHDTALGPVRRMKTRMNSEHMLRGRLMSGSQPVVITGCFSRQDFKVIGKCILCHRNFCRIIIKIALCPLEMHPDPVFFVMKVNPVRVVPCGSEADGHHIAGIRLHRGDKHLRLIAVQRLLSEQWPHMDHILCVVHAV